MKNMYSSARDETNIFSVSDRLLKFCPNNMGPSSSVNVGGTKTKGGSRTSTPGVCHPIWNNCFCKFRLILHNMHNLSCNVYNILCISYAHLLLQKHKVYMKEHQNKPLTPRILEHRDHAPRYWNSWIHHWRLGIFAHLVLRKAVNNVKYVGPVAQMSNVHVAHEFLAKSSKY